MFFATLFIALGLAILLNTLNVLNGTFWGIFWSVFFLAAGLHMLIKKDSYKKCGWGPFGSWVGSTHGSKHDTCCGHDCAEGEHERKQ